MGNQALSSGDPEAIVLFGLRGNGIKLLSVFLDRTADIQTVALAVSFVTPGILRSDRRVQRWIQTYRDALDGLKLYSTRAIFDSAQGRRARAAMEQARISGRHVEAQEVDKALKKAAPPQMVVRCQFCSTNIAPSSQPLPLQGGDRGGVGALGIKASLSFRELFNSGERELTCLFCSPRSARRAANRCRPAPFASRNHLFTPLLPMAVSHHPSCKITRANIGLYLTASNLCWCQKCRHGGESSSGGVRAERPLTHPDSCRSHCTCTRVVREESSLCCRGL